jgi:hypothetical protein
VWPKCVHLILGAFLNRQPYPIDFFFIPQRGVLFVLSEVLVLLIASSEPAAARADAPLQPLSFSMGGGRTAGGRRVFQGAMVARVNENSHLMLMNLVTRGGEKRPLAGYKPVP